MSTATDPTLHEVSPTPERGERLKDVIGLLARLQASPLEGERS